MWGDGYLYFGCLVLDESGHNQYWVEAIGILELLFNL